MISMSNLYKRLLIAFLFLLFGQCFSIVNAQTIRLKAASVTPVANTRVWIDSLLKFGNPDAQQQVIIQFNNIPSQQEKDALKAKGIMLHDYMQGNNYTAIIHFSNTISNVNISNIRSITNMQPEWKVSETIISKAAGLKNSNIDVLVSFYPSVEKNDILKTIQQDGGIIEPSNYEIYGTYKLNLPAEKLRSLAQWYGVKYISPPATIKYLDYKGKAMGKSNVPALSSSLGGYGLLGDSVVVGVGDNVSGIYHADVRDRIINYNPSHITHHGVFVNGIVGGAGIVDPIAEGMAPHVTLVDHIDENVWLLTGLMLKDHNMTITNNSYAITEGDCSYDGVYDNVSQTLDQVAIQYPSILHVFAAGNDGTLTCSPYPAEFGTVIGGFQTAKNVLVVTSTDKAYSRAFDASHGPVRDGRLKPEMTADGADAYSLIDYDAYEFADGTSFACPTVAGALALLTQQYKRLNSGANPRSDVMKTIIMNGTTDIGNPGPDFRFGFGYLNLNRSLQILNNKNYTTSTATNGSTSNFNITLPANTSQLKVMLYWHDPAANPAFGGPTLVNDLDLQVTTPTSVIHKPLILDPTPANVNNIAVEGADHLNNCEQVTINNPTAGTYTITVNGYSVSSASQDYVVAYDFVPNGLQLTYPVKGEAIKATDSMQVYWDASRDSVNTFGLELSTNNGTTWTTLNSSIPANQLYYSWRIPNVSSDQCLLRLSRNGIQTLSGPFVINPQPVVTLDSIQCPGYIRINWNSISGASAYQIMMKQGIGMNVIATVPAGITSYTFSGLSLNTQYYVAVKPIIGSTPGYRSMGIARIPSDGTCSGSFSDGDLMLTAITAPQSGRMFTSTQLKTSESLTVNIQNLDDAVCNNYKVSYKINSGTWISQVFTTPIAANGVGAITIPGLDLSALGAYNITVVVDDLSKPDPVPQNDTLVKLVYQMQNNPIVITPPFIEDFESMPAMTVHTDSIGISPNQHWDYARSVDSSARLRTYVNDTILISGSRSISLDQDRVTPGIQNNFTGTFNLSSYAIDTAEVRFDFDYIIHGKPKFYTGNELMVRGSDTSSWVTVYNYNTTSPGAILNSRSLSLTDAVNNNHQKFTSSFQVMFDQKDTSLIGARNYGNGLTIDNVRFYTVNNDVQLLSVISPAPIECGNGAPIPVTVKVKNGVQQKLTNVIMQYQLAGYVAVTDTLASINGKDSVLFTFKKPLIVPAGPYTLNVWAIAQGDTYHANDSLLDYSFHYQPLISSFPYLENFENGSFDWYTDGTNNSWQFGKPRSTKINRAPSGSNAWKTNLAGNYNNNELSYLYSPCYDISGLTNPMLSFSLATDIENCGTTLCDGAWMEYSTDGTNWAKLGTAGQGTNWYDTGFNLWDEQNNARWRVASIPLPKSTTPVRLRFVFASDPASNREGIAVDDIHIFDLKYPVYTGSSNNAASYSLASGEVHDYLQGGQYIAQMYANSYPLSSVVVSQYEQTVWNNPGRSQYLFPKSFTVESGTTLTDSVKLRLFITDADVVTMLADSSCHSCSKPDDAYLLGISKYDDPDKSKENGTLADNQNGSYVYYPYKNITWVPYDNGYYAEFRVPNFSEFWLSDGGPTHTFPLSNEYLVFNATKASPHTVNTNWTSYIDASVTDYEVQRSKDTINFTTIDSFITTHTTSSFSYIDTPTSISIGDVLYYRLKWTMKNNHVYYSLIRRVDWSDINTLISIYPNPNTNGKLFINWTATQGTELKLLIADLMGRTVFTGSVAATSWNNLTTVQTPVFPTGLYIIKLQIGNKHYEDKLIYR